jgi:hypothetical protein
MFDIDDDKSSVDVTIFDTEDGNFNEPNDCYHHIEKMSTNIQMFSIFITRLIITS